jgi:hypothetical protein
VKRETRFSSSRFAFHVSWIRAVACPGTGLPALLHRAHHDQIVAILARTVIDQLDPQRDDLAAIVKRFVVVTEPFMVLWERLYPERPPRATWTTLVGGHQETDGFSAKQRMAHQRLEAASADLIRAFRAWEQLVTPNTDTSTQE